MNKYTNRHSIYTCHSQVLQALNLAIQSLLLIFIVNFKNFKIDIENCKIIKFKIKIVWKNNNIF